MHSDLCEQTSCAPSTSPPSCRACCRLGSSWGWGPPRVLGASPCEFLRSSLLQIP